ncbi:hypothetical protein FRAHR75_250010 [Frankia sp. Hr75.2]|nr:hypothetical protein FRAHR75_250010 [Frankia sp. Hr75.2]
MGSNRGSGVSRSAPPDVPARVTRLRPRPCQARPEHGHEPTVEPGRTTMTPLEISSEHVRDLLRRGQEIALVDVREEALFAQGHPLWAANIPLSRLELDAWGRIPRRDTLVAVYGDATATAERAHEILVELGYTQVRRLRPRAHRVQQRIGRQPPGRGLRGGAHRAPRIPGRAPARSGVPHRRRALLRLPRQLLCRPGGDSHHHRRQRRRAAA